MMRMKLHASVSLALAGALVIAGCPRQQEEPPATEKPEAMTRAAPNPLWRSDEPPETTPDADPMLDRIRELAARTRSSRVNDVPQIGLGEEPPRDPTTGGAGTPAGADEPAAAPRAFTMELAPGDTLDLVVSGQPEFSGEITVREDGTIALPTTSDLVEAAGKTALALADAVADVIHPKYAKRRPNVSAVLRRSPRFVYYVFGAVRSPGRYVMPSTGVSVLDAVIRASRPTTPPRNGGGVIGFEPVRGARYGSVHVFSGGVRNDPAIVDVWAAMRGGGRTTPAVAPGQVVVVPAASGEWSEGEIGKRLARQPETKERFATGGTP